LIGGVPTELSNLNSSLKEFSLVETGVTGKIAPTLSFLDQLPFCEFGEDEQNNLSCIPPTLLGGDICGVKCSEGVTLEGDWINEDDSCKILEEGSPLGVLYQTSLSLLKNQSFTFVTTLNILCPEVGMIWSFSGTYGIQDTQEIAPNVYSLTLSFNFTQKLLNSLMDVISLEMNIACGLECPTQTPCDISSETCELRPTTLKFSSIESCPSVTANVVFDGTNQSLMGNFREVFFSPM